MARRSLWMWPMMMVTHQRLALLNFKVRPVRLLVFSDEVVSYFQYQDYEKIEVTTAKSPYYSRIFRISAPDLNTIWVLYVHNLVVSQDRHLRVENKFYWLRTPPAYVMHCRSRPCHRVGGDRRASRQEYCNQDLCSNWIWPVVFFFSYLISNWAIVLLLNSGQIPFLFHRIK